MRSRTRCPTTLATAFPVAFTPRSCKDEPKSTATLSSLVMSNTTPMLRTTFPLSLVSDASSALPDILELMSSITVSNSPSSVGDVPANAVWSKYSATASCSLSKSPSLLGAPVKSWLTLWLMTGNEVSSADTERIWSPSVSTLASRSRSSAL